MVLARTSERPTARYCGTCHQTLILGPVRLQSASPARPPPPAAAVSARVAARAAMSLPSLLPPLLKQIASRCRRSYSTHAAMSIEAMHTTRPQPAAGCRGQERCCCPTGKERQAGNHATGHKEHSAAQCSTAEHITAASVLTNALQQGDGPSHAAHERHK